MHNNGNRSAGRSGPTAMGDTLGKLDKLTFCPVPLRWANGRAATLDDKGAYRGISHSQKHQGNQEPHQQKTRLSNQQLAPLRLNQT